MQRVLPLAMLGALLTVAPLAVAQHVGAGHSAGFSGGHARGFSGGFQGNFSAPRSFNGSSGFAPRGFGAVPRMTWTPPRYGFVPRSGNYSAYRPSYGAPRPGLDRRDGDHYRRPYHRGYGGYAGYGGYPYAFANSWELLPWDLGYPDFTGYGEETGIENQPSAEEQQPSQDYAAPSGDGYRSDYAPAPWQAPAAPAASPAPVRPEPQLTLIFRDGHTQVIRNYMLTPSDVIVMDDAASGREPQIPLSDLNLPATEQAAHQAGLDFTPPTL